MQNYDENNNCKNCNQYIYDQHLTNCPHYVSEPYSVFLKRIWTQEATA